MYADQWGIFNGLNLLELRSESARPQRVCAADVRDVHERPGHWMWPRIHSIQDSYSQFCYEWPMMPGETGYLDTPVVPTTAFAEGYNHPDCDYPDATPAIASVDEPR